jgi:CRISPR-associated protein Cmr6
MGDMRDEIAKLAKARNIPLKNGDPQKKKDEHKPKRKDTQHSGGKHDGGDKVPRRVLPLYKGLGCENTSPRPMEATANTGLLFDKFCDHWSGPNKWKEQIDERKNVPDDLKRNPLWNKNPKTWFLNVIAAYLNNHSTTPELLNTYCERLTSLVTDLKGESKIFTTQWRFVSGLGMGHVLETGFVWHKILGVPYLPGSSVKGLIRAWADPKKGWSNEDVWNEVKHLFGDSDELGAGRLIVFDALPVEKPKLEVDIMNPHYAPYYEDKTGVTPPADYHSPRPIFFLTVKEGVQFKFSLAPRPGAGTPLDVACGFDLLKEALENIGAGAKTAVGYGYFK